MNGRRLALALALISSAATAQSMDPAAAAEHAALGVGEQAVPPVAPAADLPPGSIEVTVLGGSGQPEKGVSVRLGIVESSIAKGDQHSALFAVSDERGVARFDHLQTTSAFAYRPLVEREGGKFQAAPFRLNNEQGMRARLQVFPTSRTLEGLRLGTVVAYYMEPKDDRIQFEQMVSVYNLSNSAWIPSREDKFLLPEGVTGFQAQEGMSDTAVEKDEDKVAGRTYARLRGTFSPGEHQMVFSYQVPSDKASLDAKLVLPPRTAQVRVMASKSGQLKLHVAGMPEAREVTLDNGTHVWATELSFETPTGNPKDFVATLSGMPSRGWWPTAVTGVATVLMLGAAERAFRRRKGGMTSVELSELIAELRLEKRALEASHAAGELGPQTYAREQRKLEERLARALVRVAAQAAPVEKPVGIGV